MYKENTLEHIFTDEELRENDEYLNSRDEEVGKLAQKIYSDNDPATKQICKENIKNLDLMANEYQKLSEKMKELTERKNLLSTAILNNLKTNQAKTDKFTITKCKRLTFNITLDQARKIGAITEKIDDNILKSYLKCGEKIPHTISQYIRVT